jgi:hypothetical protein
MLFEVAASLRDSFSPIKLAAEARENRGVLRRCRNGGPIGWEKAAPPCGA